MATPSTTTAPTPPESKLPVKFEAVADVQRVFRKEIDRIRAQLTDATSPTMMDDITIYRILRGWKFDEAKAVQIANDTIKFRKELKLDTLRPVARLETQRQFPHYDKFVRCHPHNISHGVDRSGQPVSIERVGRGDPAELVRQVKLSELMEYHYHHMENKMSLITELTNSTGTVVRQCKIMDLSGVGRRHYNRPGLAYLKSLLHVTQLHYPEMMGNLWIVNAPTIFNLIWKIVKPWINEQTLSKICILGTNYKETLHKHVDPAQLPDFLGGTCQCGQGGASGCVAMVHPDEGMTIVNIAARAAETVKLVADGKDTLVSWQFRTRAYDIGFQVEFIPRAATKGTIVIPQNKYDASKETITGEFVAPEAGTVVLTWDNNHSRFYSKTLLHRAQVVHVEPISPTAAESEVKDVIIAADPTSSSSATVPSLDAPAAPPTPAPTTTSTADGEEGAPTPTVEGVPAVITEAAAASTDEGSPTPSA